MGKKVWVNLDEKEEAYNEVIRYMKENNLTLDEAYEKKGFEPEDRLSLVQIVQFSVQKNMSGEFLPV